MSTGISKTATSIDDCVLIGENLADENDDSFISLLRQIQRPRKYSIGALVTGIEKNGIYGWDRFGRFRKLAETDEQVIHSLNALATLYEFESNPDVGARSSDDPMLYAESESIFQCLGWQRKNLPNFDSIEASEPIVSIAKTLKNSAAENTDIRLIGVLLNFISGKIKGIQIHPSYKSQADMISIIEAEYPKSNGLSKRTMEDRFAKARPEMMILADSKTPQ